MATEKQIIAEAEKRGVKNYLAEVAKKTGKATAETTQKALATMRAQLAKANAGKNTQQIVVTSIGTTVGAGTGFGVNRMLTRWTANRVVYDQASGQWSNTMGRRLIVHAVPPALGIGIAVASLKWIKGGAGAAGGAGFGVGMAIGSGLASIFVGVPAEAPPETTDTTV